MALARLISRRGLDWGWRFPTIVAAVKALAVRSCIIDGELIACDVNGLADFQLLRWRKRDDPAIFCAFDLIEGDGRDLRDEPIETRKSELARLLTGCQPLALVLNRVSTTRPGRLRARMQARLRGHREQTAWLALRTGPVEQLAQGEKPGRAGGAAGARRGLGRIDP
jgi:ATP-dependent DNA ligase